MLLKLTFALLIARLGATVHANYIQQPVSLDLPENSNAVLGQQRIIPIYASNSGAQGNVATSSVYFQFGKPQTAQANQLHPVYVQSAPASDASAHYENNAHGSVPFASGNYEVVGAKALSDYGAGANVDNVAKENAAYAGASSEYATSGGGTELAVDEYGGVEGEGEGANDYAGGAAAQGTYENVGNQGKGDGQIIGVVNGPDSYKSESASTAYPASGAVVGGYGISGLVGIGGPVGYDSGYKTGKCGSSSCASYQSGAIIQYPAANTGYQTGGYYGRPHYGPVLFRPAQIALSPSIALVPQRHVIPVSLAPHGSHSSLSLEKFGGLEKFIDLDKLEKLLPLDLLKNIRLPSKSSFNLERLLGVLESIDLPSLTVNLPNGPGPNKIVDQLFAASEKLLPPIKLPAKPPVIISKPMAIQAPKIAVSKVSMAPIGAPVKLIKQLPVSFSKLKLPELPSLSSLTLSLESLGDLFSKFGKLEIVKREKVAPVAVPLRVSVTPQKIVTAYPLQKGPFSGHVVIEDFPYGRPQYGPFDEGGEATLGCAQLDSAVPAKY